MRDPMLARAQVAEELGIWPWSVYRLIRLGELPAAKIGRLRRVDRADVHDYIAGTGDHPASQRRGPTLS